ncbi:MAG: response regulator transcription factor [Cellulosilyticaceae bacterium]
MYTILVCDDDQAIVNSICLHLGKEGYNTIKCYDGMQAIKALEEYTVHLILMDIMMPKLDGLSTTLKIRQEHNVPIIMLSAKSEDTDKIAGLSFGADDYITKPFNTFELIARIKSQLRRYTELGSMVETEKIMITGGLCVDVTKQCVTVDGQIVRLTPTEYKILEYLMRHINSVCTINQIYEHVWQEQAFQAENTVAVHIRRLREKIEINTKDPKYIKVVWGSGYMVQKNN